jgi:hypothetical protein
MSAPRPSPEDVRLFDLAGSTRVERSTRRRCWQARQGDLFTAAPAPIDGPAPDLRDAVAPVPGDVALFGAGWVATVSLFDAGPSHRHMAPDPTAVHHLRLAVIDRLPTGITLRPGELPVREENRREPYHLLTFDAVAGARRSTVQDIVTGIVTGIVADVAAMAVCRCAYSEAWVTHETSEENQP